MASITDFLIRVKVQGQQLVDKLTKSSNDLEKGMDNASKSAGKFSGAIKGLGSSIVGMAGGVTGVASAIAAIGLRAVQSADQIQDLSDATGISSSRLLNFKQSLIEAGGKTDDFEKLASKLNQTLGDAANGNEKTRKSFKDLGIALGDANGDLRSTDELLPEVLSALSKIEDPAVRAATAVDILGKSANKIDWTKVSAINDPFKDDQIAQLAKYQGAIDNLQNKIETELITTFGRLAIAMEQPFKLESIELFARTINKTMGALQPIISGVEFLIDKISQLGGSAQRPLLPGVTPSSAGAGRGRQGGPTATELGAAGLATGATGDLKITKEDEKQLATAKAQTEQIMKQNDLANQYAMRVNETLGMQQMAGDLARSNLQIDFERDKKLADINKQIETELANKDRDIRVTEGLTAQLREQAMLEIAAAEQRKTAKADEITKLQQQRDLISDIMLLNQMQSENLQLKQLKGQNDLIGLFGDELKLKQGLMSIENERINTVMAANNRLAQLGKDVTAADDARANKEIQQAKSVADAKVKILEDQLAKEQALRENATAGAQQAIEAIARSFDPFQKAQMQVNSLFGNMSSAIDTFVDTGKFKFGDFARSVIQDLIKIELKSQASKLLSGMLSSAGSFLGSLLGFANGGEPPVNKPSIVGEKGPELFIPKTAGTIIPNGGNSAAGNMNVSAQPSVTNIINISAIDSKSVAQFFAENRKTLLGSVEMARKEMPYGSR